MILDLNQYDNLSGMDPNNSYRALRNIIDKHIRKEHEEYNRRDLERSIHNRERCERREGGPQVLPSPSPKTHPGKKKDGKGGGRGRPPTPKGDKTKKKKEIRCKFHWTEKGCRLGKECQFSQQEN